jgi:hypothetical protein
MEAIPIFVSGILPFSMTHGTMPIPPCLHPGIDIVFVGIDLASHRNSLLNQGTKRVLLDILDHPQNELPPALNHPEDGGFVGRCGATPASAFQAPPTRETACGLHGSGLPFVTRYHIDLITFNFPF